MDKNKIFILGISFILFFITLLYFTSASITELQTTVIYCNVRESILIANITCLDDNCTTNITRNTYPYGNPLASSFITSGRFIAQIYKDSIEFGRYEISSDEQYKSSYLERVFYYLNDICAENTDDITPIFSQIVNERASVFYFKPYSKERELEVFKELGEIKNPECVKYERIGNWLVVGGVQNCIKTNDNKNIKIIKNTLIYSTLLLILLFAGFLIYLHKRKSSK